MVMGLMMDLPFIPANLEYLLLVLMFMIAGGDSCFIEKTSPQDSPCWDGWVIVPVGTSGGPRLNNEVFAYIIVVRLTSGQLKELKGLVHLVR